MPSQGPGIQISVLSGAPILPPPLLANNTEADQEAWSAGDVSGRYSGNVPYIGNAYYIPTNGGMNGNATH